MNNFGFFYARVNLIARFLLLAINMKSTRSSLFLP
jgi:hypothetical protein